DRRDAPPLAITRIVNSSGSCPSPLGKIIDIRCDQTYAATAARQPCRRLGGFAYESRAAGLAAHRLGRLRGRPPRLHPGPHEAPAPAHSFVVHARAQRDAGAAGLGLALGWRRAAAGIAASSLRPQNASLSAPFLNPEAHDPSGRIRVQAILR